MFKNIKDLINFQPPKSSKSDSNNRNDFNFLNLIKKWEPIVGEMVYKHTRPLRLNKNKLIIVTDHPAFSQQLTFLKEPLIKKVLKEFPSLQGLKDLQFETNAALFVAQSKKVAPKVENKTNKVTIHPLSPKYNELKKLAIAEVAQHYKSDDKNDEFRESLEKIYLNILLSKEAAKLN